MSRNIERIDWANEVRQRGQVFKRQPDALEEGSDFEILTPIARRDERWQEIVLVALTKFRPARPSTAKWLKHAATALLELTF